MNKVKMDRATGEYIGIVEPDDYVDLHMFEDLYRMAAENRLNLVKADFYRFTQDADGTEQLQYVYLDGAQTRYGELLNPSQDTSCIRFTLKPAFTAGLSWRNMPSGIMRRRAPPSRTTVSSSRPLSTRSGL